MRPTLSRLRTWDPAALTEHADAIAATGREHLAAVVAGHGRTRDAAWTGVAAAAAQDRAARELHSATAVSGTMDDIAVALRTGAATIGAARDAALAVAGEASEGMGLRVADSGRVSAPPVPWLGGVLATALVRALLSDAARTQQARLAVALDAVDEADRALAAALTRAAADAPSAGTDTVADPRGGPPEWNSRWWAALTSAQQRSVVTDHPEWIGNLDGIPAHVRDEANRARLAADRRDLEQRIGEIRTAGRYRESLGATGSWDRAEVRAARDRLAQIDAVAQSISAPDRQLLVYRDEPRLRAAVAVGDVDTADHVAVFTPGVNSTVGDDLGRYADTMTNLGRDAEGQLAAAGRGDERIASVVWMDYHAPQLNPDDPVDSVRDAVRDLGAGRAATTGAGTLASFFRGVAASRPDGVHLTALGHSYGSTTTGLAMQRTGTGVDDAVFFGSPGLGTDDVRDLGLPPGHVFVAEAPGDPIADLAAYGADPSRLPGVTTLSTAGDASRSGSTGHSGYLDEGSTSMHNIAAVVAGLPDRIVAGGDVGIGDRVPVPVLGDLRERIFGGVDPDRYGGPR